MTIFEILSVQSMFKYEELINMMKTYNKIRKGDTVDIYVNLEYIIDNLQSRRFCDTNEELSDSLNIKNVISSIFSIVAHYRNFFIYYDVYPRIYLYISDIKCDIRYFSEYDVNPNFRTRYRRKCQSELTQDIFDLFIKSIPIIQTICKYIEDVYFIVSEGIDSSLIPYVVPKKINNKTHKVIISHDDLDDLYYLANNTIRIKIKRRMNKRVGIVSINDILINDYKVNDTQLYMSNTLFMAALIASLNKQNIRNIDNILGYGPASLTKDIYNGINNGIITHRTDSIDLFKNVIQEKYREDMVTNLKQIDIKYRLNKIQETNINLLYSQMVNIYDIEGLKKITTEIFHDYPFDLNNLLKKPKFMINGR